MSFLSKAWRTVGLGAFGSKGLFGKALGLGGQDDLGAAMDKQLKAQQEAAKLSASNEAQNVVQFDATNPTGTVGTSDVRRKKQMAGSYATGLGLNV